LYQELSTYERWRLFVPQLSGQRQTLLQAKLDNDAGNVLDVRQRLSDGIPFSMATLKIGTSGQVAAFLQRLNFYP